MFSKATDLESCTLSLCDVGIDPRGLALLCDLPTTITKIELVDLGSRFGARGAKFLAKAIKVHTHTYIHTCPRVCVFLYMYVCMFVFYVYVRMFCARVCIRIALSVCRRVCIGPSRLASLKIA